MSLVRWAAITLLLFEAAIVALYALVLGWVAASTHHLSWVNLLLQGALLVAMLVIFAAVPAAIAFGSARRASWWLWAGAAYQLAWALLLTPVILGSRSDVSRVGLVGAILFLIAALGQRRRRPRRS